MFESLRISGAATLLALALASGCGGSEASETDELPTQEFQQALSKEKVFLDAKGRRWKNNGKVTYAKTTYEDLKQDVAATALLDSPRLSMANLDELTDDEAVQVMRPRMEFGNTEFVMDDEDARDIVGVVRQLKKERHARTARGVGAGEAGGQVEQSAAGGAVDGTTQGLIVNGDQRANNNYRANQYPYNTVAQSGTPSDPWCTCFKMINDYTCVTAGHCHWWKGAWQAPRPITFQAGSSSPRTQIPANCYARTTWYSGGDDHSYDIAVIALRGRGGAWCNPASYNVGYLGWNEPADGDFDGWSAGYPAPPPFGWSYPTQTHQSSANNRVELNWFVTYTLDTSGGQSGAPIVTTWSSGGYRVRASHWGALSSSANRNYGIAMWSEIVDLLKGAAGY